MHFTKMLGSVLTLCLIANNLLAEIQIDKAHRVANRGYGVCAWCAIETSGTHLGIDAVKGLAEKRDKRSKEMVKKLDWRFDPGTGWMRVLIEVERRDNGGTIERMQNQLDELKIRYKSQFTGNRDTKLLYEGVKDGGPGAIVGVYDYKYTPTKDRFRDHLRYQAPKGPTGYHAILITDIDDEWVCFIDPNDISEPWIVSRGWFNYRWDGSVILLIPEEKAQPKVEEKPPKAEHEEAKAIQSEEFNPHHIAIPKPVKRHKSPWVQSLIDSGMTEEEALKAMDRLNTDPLKKDNK